MSHKTHRNRALTTLFLFNGIFVFGANMLGPLYALYVSGIQNGALAASLSWAVYLVSATIFTSMVGALGDKVKETEYFLIGGYFLRSACWISYIFIPDWTWLLIVQAGIGLGEALGTPAFDALLAVHLDKGKHMANYANWKVISNLVMAVGTVIGGYIVNYYGFTPLFIIMSLLSTIAGVGILVKPRKLL